jgi:hypothetical protein
MAGGDKRQTQDERALERDGAEDAREEYTTYREVDPDQASQEEAGARREADLQPGPTREGEETDPEDRDAAA